MYLLLAWVVVVVVIPSGLGYLMRYYRPERTEEASLQELDRRYEKDYGTIPYTQKGSWNMAETDMHGGESLLGITREEALNRLEYNKKVFPLKFRYAEDRYRIVKEYADRLDNWRRVRDNMIRPSLWTLYGSICSAICGTSSDGYRSALVGVRVYRDELMNFLSPKVGKPEWFTRILEYPDMEPTERNQRIWNALAEKEGPDVYFKIWDWDKVAPVDLQNMPGMRIESPGLSERLNDAANDLIILLGISSCFVIISFYRVLRYAVD
jgi:hypothetical protein